MKLFKIISSLFRSNKTTTDETLKIQKEGAALAVACAKAYQFKLDYSVASLKKVDQLLLLFGKEYLATKNKTNFENFALTFGLYIIEVMERNHRKGYLERKLLGLQEDDFPYYWNGNLIFPCIWCFDRIFKS
ncbi:MAG: hypothetical protein WD512_17035, partial [Candidatus Paceibacterota bacterium]